METKSYTTAESEVFELRFKLSLRQLACC